MNIIQGEIVMKKMKCCILVFMLISTMVFASDLEIIDKTNYHNGNWIVAGLIKNNSTKTFSFVSLTLKGSDSNGLLVHTDSTYAFSPITPGSEIPFLFLTSEEDARSISKFSISIDDYSVGGKGTFKFAFSQLSITERNNTFVKYSGEITNQNDSLKKYVNIAFIGFDNNGKLVCVETTYPNKTSLAVNSSSVFEILIKPEVSNKISKYRCIGFSD